MYEGVYMRRTLIIYFCVLIMLVLCGCQNTPEQDIVINKGGGQLEKAIAGPPAKHQTGILDGCSSDGNNSKEWKEKLTLQYLTCEIDADVILPAINEFPVFKVRKRDFDTETVKKIVEYFVEGATGVRETSMTRGELEELLIQVKRGQYVWDDNGSRWESYQGQKEDIVELEEQVANAEPEVFNPVTDNAVSIPMDKTYAMPNDERVYVDVNSQYIYINPIKFGVIQPETWIIDGEAYPGEAVGTTIDNIKISKDDAENTVEELLSELGIKNFGIAEVEKARIIKDFTYDIVSEGWQITLSRNDGNCVPVYINSAEVSGLLYYQTDDYIDRWRQESITIFVDENGARSFYWQYPLEIVEKLNSNVQIKPFEEIREKIRNYLKFAHTQFSQDYMEAYGEVVEQQITLSKVVLTNVLVPIKDESEYHMLIPAWVVYYEQEDGLGIHTFVIAINAIDASSIDLALRTTSHRSPK